MPVNSPQRRIPVHAEGPKVRVLIVDDDPDMRTFARIALALAGFDAVAAADGQRALALQREEPADVLLTDIFMTEPDGLELIQEFKVRFPQTKIVAMSGGGRIARSEFLGVATEIGAEAVLLKPFTTEALVRTLQRLTAR